MDKSRQQFEEWFKKEYPLIEAQPENTLLQSVKRQCQKAWQASRESLEVELPRKTNPTDTFYDSFDLGLDVGISQCRRAIISSGVKIKNE
ncbi:hypothetical protein V5085_01975 [Moellerella wisconsensis]|uniref:hypothetical protein n=1 Tax=Moellerella wisconsensis TaxID=158849 RepID=UPI003076557E